jgi:hypothetical protein
MLTMRSIELCDNSCQLIMKKPLRIGEAFFFGGPLGIEPSTHSPDSYRGSLLLK